MNEVFLIVGLIAGLMTILGIDGLLKWKHIKSNKPISKDKLNEIKLETQFDFVHKDEALRYKIFFPQYIFFKFLNGGVYFPNKYFNKGYVSKYKNKYNRLYRISFNLTIFLFLPILVFTVDPFFIFLMFFIIIFTIFFGLKSIISRFIKSKDFNFKYDRITRFDNDYYMTYLSGKKGLLDNSYNELIPSIFDKISRVSKDGESDIGFNFIQVELDKKIGLFNFDGSQALPVIYDKYYHSIQNVSLYNKSLEIKKDGTKYRINSKGKRKLGLS